MSLARSGPTRQRRQWVRLQVSDFSAAVRELKDADLVTDERHCGECGAVCTGPMTCFESACGYREILTYINAIRTAGITCPGATMPSPPVPALTWSDVMESAELTL